MIGASSDYAIFDRFKFERAPIAVRFSLNKPSGLKPLAKNLALCELFKEAQTAGAFFASRENIQCGEHILGMKTFPPLMRSGALGEMFSMFKDPRANRRVYDYIPLMEKDTVNYISLAPLGAGLFEPDLAIFTCNASQAEVLLRASSFSSGRMWSSKSSTCLACAWIFAYPYLSGELNYTVSGLGYSMKARQVLPDGLLIISVPADLLGELADNLAVMDWQPYWFGLGREGFIQEVENRTREVAAQIPRPPTKGAQDGLFAAPSAAPPEQTARKEDRGRNEGAPEARAGR